MTPVPGDRPRRGRSRVKIDLSHRSRWRIADLVPLFHQLGLPTDVGLGQDFPGLLDGRAAFVEPERMAYVEGRLRLTLPELYAVRHGQERDDLTSAVEAVWFDRLRFDAGRLDLPRVRRVHERWRAARTAELTDNQRRVLDSIILLDALHRGATWRPGTPDETGMMLARRFLGPWASDPRPDRHISPKTAERCVQHLLALGLLAEVPQVREAEPVSRHRAPRFYRLTACPVEMAA
ncbi:hypothetical protein FSW04_17900 [Baekduia soli]|uniref:Uncharacterized protein n=1 Tax=Baekduia soli TaxID=496014 RepID=A0A5B8U826_9ACTN|nr:hypothetical protein [Baekduia soli]QEC49266.1 hypothetical protein FSW04_17900 [Baekduia soli]